MYINVFFDRYTYISIYNFLVIHLLCFKNNNRNIYLYIKYKCASEHCAAVIKPDYLHALHQQQQRSHQLSSFHKWG